jgi:UDP-N-acetylmuramate dehydrogenase
MKPLIKSLQRVVGDDRVYEQAPLASMTTFRVGGPADILVETRSSDELLRTMEVAIDFGVPVTLLGGGSNVLVSDAGVRGVVIRPRGGSIRQVDGGHVQADAAVTINGLVRWTVLRGLAGLERWAGTPGTVGGAIFGNAHFGGHLISELVSEVRLVDRRGRILDVAASTMGFGYDRSRLQDTGEVLLSATFHVTSGDIDALRSAARASLAYRKRTQPLDSPSAGCVFRNPEPERDVVPGDIPWSAGALIDRAGLKGASIGGARVSTTHGNFIVNEGGASAADIRALIDRCRNEVKRQFDVKLREEIVFLGDFTPRSTASS